ncbi:uncharacterized protein LOC130113504 isoform X2 [Lampris incognitus]|uniref:uncharacterized protein LOC130113504 isoform X2 n=1 Tax=Lampris incognitus TaxID=2546036 RepID=UPI0024B53B3F|nr:uncharacterized protein LOC130113504 isoform X2 [Lampris incognitus]
MDISKMIFLITAFLLGGLCGVDTEGHTVVGIVGHQITITCSHANADSNFKYFCNRRCTDEDVLVASEGHRESSKGRFHIKDEGNTFYVQISALRKTDSGVYWCGVDRIGLDTYMTIQLTVVDDGAVITDQLVYIAAGLGIAVLVPAPVVLIFIRKRRRKTSTSSGEDRDSMRAVPLNQQQDVNTTTCSSVGNDNQETEFGSKLIYVALQHQNERRVCTNTIHSNVTMSKESQVQPDCDELQDQALYATVNHNGDVNSSAAPPHTEGATYSTIKIKSEDSDDNATVTPGLSTDDSSG